MRDYMKVLCCRMSAPTACIFGYRLPRGSNRNCWRSSCHKTGEMFDPDSFRHTYKKILKAISMEHIRFHDLRHTFATLSLKNGVDVKTLSSTLGHYSAGFTPSTYTYATPDMMREAADTMGDVTTQINIRRHRVGKFLPGAVPFYGILLPYWSVYWSEKKQKF